MGTFDKSMVLFIEIKIKMGKRIHGIPYCFFRVAINPLNIPMTAKATGTMGVPVFCIPMVLLVSLAALKINTLMIIN